jgi:predicted ATPase
MQTPPHYVLTGGPCAGKTTTVDELAKRGYDISPEPGRIYFEAQLKEGKTLEGLLSDMPALEKNILRKHVELERANRKEGILFFDRGIPDCLAYYRVYGVPEDAELQAALADAKYRKIFLLDLIETFSNDAVRVETPEQARHIHESIRAAYTELGYDIIDVPVMPVSERVGFILANL